MGLIGKQYDIGGRHPQELIDDLYDEVFDQYPESGEVDVAIVVRHPEDGGNPVTIVDYLVFRTSDGEGNNEFLMSDRPHTSNGVFVDNIRNTSIWARERLAQEGIETPSLAAGMFIIHKHPEGVPPTGKDADVIDLFNSFDVILTNDPSPDENGNTVRVFNLFAVVNRDESWPGTIFDGAPRPTGLLDVDFGVIDTIMIAAAPDALEHGWATPEQVARVEELADSIRPFATMYGESDDEDVRATILSAAKGFFIELVTIWSEFARNRARELSNPDTLMEALRSAGLHDLADALENLTLDGGATASPDVLGQGPGLIIPMGNVPQPMAAEPMDVDLDKVADALREPQARPSSIFDLPDIDDLDDDAEVRWN